MDDMVSAHKKLVEASDPSGLTDRELFCVLKWITKECGSITATTRKLYAGHIVNMEMGTPNRSRIRIEPSIECRDVGTSPWSPERKETPSHVSTSLPRPMDLRTKVEAVATRDWSKSLDGC
ncbi:hypothetical protein ACOME3_008772 [Neoechinorhynchus agilis]